MPVLTMHMAVRNFFCSRCAYLGHLDGKTQGLAGHRVVAVQHDGVALDFCHGERMGLAVIAAPFELAADFHAGGELCFRYGFNQAFIAQAKGIFPRK